MDYFFLVFIGAGIIFLLGGGFELALFLFFLSRIFFFVSLIAVDMLFSFVAVRPGGGESGCAASPLQSHASRGL